MHRWLAPIAVFCCLSLGATLSPASAHNIFTTFTRIDWNKRAGTLEFVIQVHASDLEARLSLDLKKRLTFLEKKDYPALEHATGPWALHHLQLDVNDKPLPLTYLGMEMKDQLVYLYLETSCKDKPKQIRVMNSMFLEDLPGELNSVMAVVEGVRKAGEITGDSGSVEMEF